MDLDKIVVAVGKGHRKKTPGKQSPNHVLKEWEWNEDCGNVVIETLLHQGLKVVDVTPKGDNDSLAARVNAVNALCSQYGKKNVIYVSIHANAAGKGDWMTARRWSVWTTRGTTDADALAEKMYEAALAKWGPAAVRSQLTDGDHDYEENFYVLRNTRCPAVLVENFFYDNPEDYKYLISATSHYDCAEVICNGINKYLREWKQ